MCQLIPLLGLLVTNRSYCDKIQVGLNWDNKVGGNFATASSNLIVVNIFFFHASHLHLFILLILCLERKKETNQERKAT